LKKDLLFLKKDKTFLQKRLVLFCSLSAKKITFRKFATLTEGDYNNN